jgi:hypothetical protein
VKPATQQQPASVATLPRPGVQRDNVCHQCGATFPAFSHAALYCCGCDIQRETERKRAWMADHKDWRRNWTRAYYSKPEVAQRRKELRQARPVNVIAQAARGRIKTEILNGRLKPQPCEMCGSFPVQGHHDDYGKPLAVRWLCPSHHRQHHAALSRVREAK